MFKLPYEHEQYIKDRDAAFITIKLSRVINMSARGNGKSTWGFKLADMVIDELYEKRFLYGR